MSDDIETKLAAARTRLILDKPFLGALVLRLPMVAADPRWCKTTATDARKFFYNPQFIGQLSSEETQFILAHEALHCALSHFARRQHRVKRLWDVACDYAINPLLIKDGLKAPPGSLSSTTISTRILSMSTSTIPSNRTRADSAAKISRNPAGAARISGAVSSHPRTSGSKVAAVRGSPIGRTSSSPTDNRIRIRGNRSRSRTGRPNRRR
jgi:hypothetical protein